MSRRTFQETLDAVLKIYGIHEVTLLTMMMVMLGPERRHDAVSAVKNPTARRLFAELAMETSALHVPPPSTNVLDAMDHCGFDEFTFTEDRRRPRCLSMREMVPLGGLDKPFRARAVSVNRDHRTVRQVLLDEGQRPATLAELLAFLTAYPRFPMSLTAQGTIDDSRGVARFYMAHTDETSDTYQLSLVPETRCTPSWTRHLVVEYE